MAMTHLIDAAADKTMKVGIARVINHDMSRARPCLDYGGNPLRYPNTRAAMKIVRVLIRENCVAESSNLGYTPYNVLTGEVL